MPAKTLVSIITPSYNQAAFLENAILSVLAQEAPKSQARIEYLVVDGGSQDGSLEVLRKYADRIAWWTSKPDSGQAEAINKGFAKAQGEVVAWLNSDDLYLPGAVEAAVHALNDNPDVGMVFSDALTIDERGRPLNRLVFGDWGLADFMKFRIICQPAVFMRQEALEKGGRLDNSYAYMLDHKLWLQIARHSPALHVRQTWAAARRHPEAKNVAHAAGFGQEIFRLLAWMSAQPDLAPRVEAERRQVLAGAQRLKARYLLDGDLPGPALAAYLRALRLDPPYALKHWHRMLFAALSLAGMKRLAGWYYHRRYRRPPDLSAIAGTGGWPGLQIETPVKR
ncbi:MAG: glycosyltransferase family 2 protein [Anaerolineales bacterium]|nr:glycosyltransferase family 2 protein [Anaerolineales bacterium]